MSTFFQTVALPSLCFMNLLHGNCLRRLRVKSGGKSRARISVYVDSSGVDSRVKRHLLFLASLPTLTRQWSPPD
ncbi:hypothetical protein B0H17DRAFT_1035407 [Mycena rosella]|uniref:Uncharacterized protein n=1 Tax=Mycena rosella TaxID=1033263 RepID=A0AAD7GVG5_MYCRO|nr:hypothetical protein B0H17DRAFT_1035407 [Mycena rosella]